MADVEVDIMEHDHDNDNDDDNDQEHDLDDSGDGEEILGLVDNAAGNMTYRLVHIAGEDGNSILSNSSGPQLFHPNSHGMSDSVSSMHAVLANSLNGQYQVVGGAHEVFNSSGGITLIPRENNQKGITTVKKRDDRRRATHNEVERRRRDKINNWIMRLSKIIPASTESSDKSGLEVQSKGGILARACEYIMELKESEQRLTETLIDNKRLTEELNALLVQITTLKKTNQILKNQLSQHDIKTSPDSSEDS